MLLSLHVKNLALIDECEIEFDKNLNILTGETGAGKSILIDSVNIALGGRVPKDIIRKDAEYAFVELVFGVDNTKQTKKLNLMDIYPEDNQVIISRKITNQRNVSKINGETVSVSAVKEAASILIDIHGQHEHQSLLYKKKHLEILDEYSREKNFKIKESVKELYGKYHEYKQELERNAINDEEKNREVAFLQYEIKEIEDADIKENEDEILETAYRRLSNGKQIVESLSKVYEFTGYQRGDSAGTSIGHGIKEIQKVAEFDEQISQAASILNDVESLLNDFNRTISDYMSDNDFSEQEFREVESRLDLINNLKAKYGKTIEKVRESAKAKQKRLDDLRNYDEYVEELQNKINITRNELLKACEELSSIRQNEAKELTKHIIENLCDLNFLHVNFVIEFNKLEEPSANGFEEVEFLISTNPGEEPKSLGAVASGGELSRIMLAIKTVLAQSDDIETLIFDEIDTGISGVTAQMVAEKMSLIGKNHQVIAITHLPQIAAMADSHFLIEKSVDNNTTYTEIKKLGEEKSVEELARILGGSRITETVLNSAREMKEFARSGKK